MKIIFALGGIIAALALGSLAMKSYDAEAYSRMEADVEEVYNKYFPGDENVEVFTIDPQSESFLETDV